MLLPADIKRGTGWVVEERGKDRKHKSKEAEVAIASASEQRSENPAFSWWSSWEERVRLLEEYNEVERHRAMAWFLDGVVLEEEER